MNRQKIFYRLLFITSLMVSCLPFVITQIWVFSGPEVGTNQCLLVIKDQATDVHTGADAVPPLIVNVTHSPKYPLDRDKVFIAATVMDNSSGVKSVTLVYDSVVIFVWYGQHWGWGIYQWMWWGWSTETVQQTLLMTRIGNTTTYGAELMELPYRTKVFYKVSASDNAGNIAFSEVHHYYVVRGTQSIIYGEVSQMLQWIGYLVVLLLLIMKAGRIEKKSSE